MAVFNWSALASGDLAFSPAADQLLFDTSDIQASDVLLDFSSGSVSVISYGGKTVTLLTAPGTLSSADFSFANGTLLLLGTAGNDSLTGSSGNDQLVGGAGNDTLNGGAGGSHDAASYAGAISGVTVSLAIVGAQATGGAGTDTLVSIEDLRGSHFGDSLVGGAGYNILYGLGGNDTLDGGASFDDLYGGTGNDTFIVNQSDDFVFESPDEGRDIVFSSATFVLNDGMSIGVEDLTLTGAGDLNATGNSLDNALTGNSGNNQLDGGAGSDVVAGGGGSDTLIGAIPQAFTIERVDVDSLEVQASAHSSDPSISAHGRYVAFESFATNLVPDDTNGWIDIFVRDTVNGTLTRVSTDAAGAQANQNSFNASISGDGLLVAFNSDASLVAGDPSAISDVYVKNLATGAVTLASTSSAGVIGSQDSFDPALSANGLFVAFESAASNLVAGDSNARNDIFVKNLATNATTLVSADIGGNEGSNHSGNAAISADGRYVAFDSASTNLVAGDSNASDDVFVKDLQTGSILRASTDSGGTQGNGGSLNPSISADGRFIAFHSTADNLVAGDTNGVADVFVKDLLTGAVTRVSTNLAGVQGNGDSTHASISADGHIVAFQSVANNLVPNDFSAYDIFVKDLATGVVTRLSTDTAGAGGNNNSTQVAISSDARFVAFESMAFNLVTPDANGAITDVYAASVRAADLLQGGAGDDSYSISSVLDVVAENPAEGIDTVQAGISYALTANVEHLTLSEIAAALNGTGNTLGNIISGNSFGNQLDGGVGADTLVGGAGNDTYVVDDALDVVTEVASAGTDTVLVGFDYTLGVNLENLTLTGTGGFDATGNSVNNVLTGNSGDNRLDGLGGADTMAGGLGTDTYVVDDAGDTVNEVAGGAQRDVIEAHLSLALPANVEDLVLIGVDLDGTGNNLSNVITGTLGSNVLDGSEGSDTLIGGAGDDRYIVEFTFDQAIEAEGEGHDTVESSGGYSLFFSAPQVEDLILTGTDHTNGNGNALDNLIMGNPGGNGLDGREGADTMVGGLGNDAYWVDDAGDVVVENPGEGRDEILATIGYTLLVDFEDLTLVGFDDIDATGNGVANRIVGNSGDNLLDGAGGADSMVGGEGDDTYVADSDDILDELFGSGIDTVLALNQLSGSLGSELENLVLVGADIVNGLGNIWNNHITGNDIGNLLEGDAGDDTLDGAGGADTLWGSGGHDSMTGGAGDDDYEVDSGGDVVIEASAAGIDRVTVGSITSYALGANVENLVMRSGVSDATGNVLDNLIVSNDNDNVIDGGAGTDTVSFETFVAVGVTVQLNVTGTPNAFGVLSGLDTLINVENVTGSQGHDTIEGDAGANLLIGGAGRDTVSYLYVAGGPVALDLDLATATVTGEGNDTISGFENAVGSAFDDTLVGAADANVLDGGAGGMDWLEGRAGNDSYVVDNAGDTVIEDSANPFEIDGVRSTVSWTLGANLEDLWLLDTAAIDGTGNALNNTILANVSDNVLDGAGGSDDLLSYEAGAIAGVTVSLAAVGVQDTGGSGFDTVLNFEHLRGSDFNDRLTGDAGANSLDGWLGADTLIGGAGGDTYVVFDAGDLVLETSTVADEIDTVLTTVSYSLGANLENLILNGTGNLNGAGNQLNNLIIATLGDNVLDGGGGNDTVSYAMEYSAIFGTGVAARLDLLFAHNTGGSGQDTLKNIENLIGTACADTLTGSSTANLLEGGDGDDSLGGGAGADTLDGDAGNDTLDGGAGQDTLLGGGDDDTFKVDNPGDTAVEYADEGVDTVVTTASFALGADVENLTLVGTASINGTGNELENVLTGNAGANSLDGGAGDDMLTGGFGIDSLNGGADDDILAVSATGIAGETRIIFVPDVVTEAAAEGVDAVFSNTSYTLPANVESLILTGAPMWRAYEGRGNDLDNNISTSGAARQRLYGEGGNDVLNGGAGADQLFGGAGDDILVWDAADPEIDGGTGSDALMILVTGVVLDLTTVSNLAGLETINMSPGNSLVVDLQAVLDLSDTDTLRVDGNDSSVNMGGGWTQGAEVDIGGVFYHSYTQDAATLLIHPDIAL